MNVLILGAGQVGQYTARYLAENGYDVTIIDQSAAVIQQMTEGFEVKGIVGNCTHPDILARADAANAALVFACTNSDEQNMLACKIVDSLFQVPFKIARLRNSAYLQPQWNALFENQCLAIDAVILPELEVANALWRSIQIPGALDVIPVGDGIATVVSVRCITGCMLLNTPLRQLIKVHPTFDSTIMAIIRQGQCFIPQGNDQLYVDDLVYVLIKTTKIPDVMALFNFNSQLIRYITVVGGGEIGLALARFIEQSTAKIQLRLIESNPERAHFVATQLNANIYVGSGLDLELLNETNLSNTDAFVAVTDDGRDNLMSAMLGKNFSRARTFALLHDSSYLSFAHKIGIDTVIHSRTIILSKILAVMRRNKVHTLYSLPGCMDEIIEIEVPKFSAAIGQKVYAINILGNRFVTAIIRQGEMIEITMETSFMFGDRVVIMVKHSYINTIEQLFINQSIYTSDDVYLSTKTQIN